MNKFKVSPRSNYMSLSDKAQDLSIKYLISQVVKTNKIKIAKCLLSELESRIDSELTEDEYFDVLDKCNPTY